MKRTYRDSSSNANMKATETKDTLVNPCTEYNNDADKEDEHAAFRANRNACLGGDSMRHAMCDDHLKPRKGKKDNFSKVGENVALLRECNNESDEEDQLVALRDNRNACLGGDSVRNAMCDDHLKPRKGKKDDFTKVGENVALLREYNDESDGEDQLAALRANRNACLGGDSMRHAMCDDHLKPRKGKKDNFSKVGENTAPMRDYNGDSDEEDQLAALRSNRNACLGSESMKTVMCDDHLKPIRGEKENFSKIGENNNVKTDNNGSLDEDQLAFRANRNACLGSDCIRHAMCDDHLKPRKGKKDNFSKVGESIISMKVSNTSTEDTEHVMKSYWAESMGGSEMKGLFRGQEISLPSCRSRNLAPLKKSTRSSSVPGPVNVNTTKAMKTNRAANMGGSNMRNILYGQNPSLPSARSRYATLAKNSVRSSSVSGSLCIRTENDMKSNSSFSMKGSDMKNIIYGQNSSPSVKSIRASDRNFPKDSARSLSSQFTVDADKAFRANRFAIMGGSAMKNLLYGNTFSKRKNRTPLKKSVRSSSSEHVSGTMNGREWEMTSNPSADAERAGQTLPPITSRSCTRTGAKISARFTSGCINDADKAMKTNRSRSMGGLNMRNLLHRNLPPLPTSRSNKRSVLKISNHSEDNANITITGNEKPRRSSSTEGSVMKSLIYSRSPSPPALMPIRKAPLKKSLRGTAKIPFMQTSPSGYEEESSHIDCMLEKGSLSRRGCENKFESPRYGANPVIRYSAFEGDTMKNLLYGDSAPATSTASVYDDTHHKISDGEDAIEIQVQDEYHSNTSLHQDKADEGNITLDFFSVESPEEPVGVLIPYDVINQFAPECGGNIERTAVALKHGNLVDCTCRMKMKNQRGKHPCVRHIMPKDLQFYNEASKVLHIISSPFGEENDRKNSAIENNIARKYPNYYKNFVQKFNRQLSEKYRTKERQGKMAVVKSYEKLLAEENLFSKRAKCPINKKQNISGKMKDLEKDFIIACENLKKDYPFLFVQLIQENDFPSLALEKNVVDENRICLLEISQLETKKLREFEEIFTNQQLHP